MCSVIRDNAREGIQVYMHSKEFLSQNDTGKLLQQILRLKNHVEWIHVRKEGKLFGVFILTGCCCSKLNSRYLRSKCFNRLHYILIDVNRSNSTAMLVQLLGITKYQAITGNHMVQKTTLIRHRIQNQQMSTRGITTILDGHELLFSHH